MADGVVQTAANPDATGTASSAQRRWRSLQPATGVVLTVAALLVGWYGRDLRGWSAGSGVGYLLGIVGGSMMLALLLYSFRKRIRWLRHLGATKHWFRMHMTLGIIGPLLILYHCNFQVGSLNSQVALYCTLLVACSGIVGRYFYAQIHNGLYGTKASLKQLVAAVESAEADGVPVAVLSRPVAEQLARRACRVLQDSADVGSSLIESLRAGIETRLLYRQLKRAAARHIDAEAEQSPLLRRERTRMKRSANAYLKRRLTEVRRAAQFRLFERLFSWWHIVHVPFFLMLVLTAIVHVVAVHMY